jgi:hypothetical protein
MRQRYRSIYEDFKPQFCYFKVIILLRRLLFAVIIEMCSNYVTLQVISYLRLLCVFMSRHTCRRCHAAVVCRGYPPLLSLALIMAIQNPQALIALSFFPVLRVHVLAGGAVLRLAGCSLHRAAALAAISHHQAAVYTTNAHTVRGTGHSIT